MTQEEKAKAYDEALEKARMYRDNAKAVEEYAAVARYENIFPELRESEDERIRKALICGLSEGLSEHNWQGFGGATIDECLAYLEKQKEPKQTDLPAGFYFIDLDGKKYYSKEFRYGDMKLKVGEQKPISQDDFDTAKHEALWGEPKPVDDSDFKTKLAEYMTKNCTGYSYNISSESILQMAKEELIKRGELQKPVEWSEEDEKIRRNLMSLLANMRGDRITEETYKKYYPWLSALRPGWKPTEEQMKALNWARCLIFETYTDKHIATEPYHILGELYDQLKQLKDGTDTND